MEWNMVLAKHTDPGTDFSVEAADACRGRCSRCKYLGVLVYARGING